MEKRGVSMKRNLSKYNNNKHNMARFYNKFKKYDEIQLTKNKMDLNKQKMINHPPSPQKIVIRNGCKLLINWMRIM